MRMYSKLISLFLIVLLCGCTQTKRQDDYQILTPSENNDLIDTSKYPVFTEKENGNLIDSSGVEYALLANEHNSSLSYLGDMEFAGTISGEAESSQSGLLSFQPGLGKFKNNESDSILIRFTPDSEWISIYRKCSLPTFDFSADNCIRLEFKPGSGMSLEDEVHLTCTGGISDKTEMIKFLSEVRNQKNPRDAGLYDLIRKPDGSLDNCYFYGVVYGFFDEEPNLVLRMDITSYNDLAYSICIEGNEYVLPESWLKTFQSTKCVP